ncbi:MAG: hypothetical protein DI549_00665 [Ancylobacter novellus]|uniref:Uncharacterized protein n=1 Tax=Ancylobacter novellus TaxID=921 RepID=A0A2W5STA7_ANCNO|nr:MAG: hypothetical protein DI549_00665 [Ancylobacter novellus]
MFLRKYFHNLKCHLLELAIDFGDQLGRRRKYARLGCTGGNGCIGAFPDVIRDSKTDPFRFLGVDLREGGKDRDEAVGEKVDGCKLCNRLCTRRHWNGSRYVAGDPDTRSIETPSVYDHPEWTPEMMVLD